MGTQSYAALSLLQNGELFPELESLPLLSIPGELAWFLGEPAKTHRKSLNFPESMKGRSERWPQIEGVSGMGLQAGNLKGKG